MSTTTSTTALAILAVEKNASQVCKTAWREAITIPFKEAFYPGRFEVALAAPEFAFFLTVLLSLKPQVSDCRLRSAESELK